MIIHQKIEIQQSSSAADAANMRSKALAAADVEIKRRYALRDSAVAAVLDAAAAEYASDGKGWVLRLRFCDYLRRMAGLDPIARHIALSLALDAEVAASGALEVTFTMKGLGETVGHGRDTVRNHIVEPGGLKDRGLVEVIEKARGGGQTWHLRLVIGAVDSDLPAKAVASFVGRVRASAGRAAT